LPSWSETGRPSMQYQRSTQMAVTVLVAALYLRSDTTYNLELTRHQSEVDQLYSGPDQVVGLERRNIDILELLLNLLTATSFCHSHESEEGSETNWCEQKLVKGGSLRCCAGASSVGKRENAIEEAEPLVLDGSHNKTICHESCQSARCISIFESLFLALGSWNELFLRDSAVYLMDLDGQSIVLGVGATGFANGTFSDCCESLGDSVGYTTKHLDETSGTNFSVWSTESRDMSQVSIIPGLAA
ncbi:hypothetical protein KCU85_g96, partial [Aureobasidium melanogenum]